MPFYEKYVKTERSRNFWSKLKEFTKIQRSGSKKFYALWVLHKDSRKEEEEKKKTIINIPVGKPICYIRARQSRAVDLLSGVDETDRSILWNKLTFLLAPLYISPFWIRIIPRRGMRLSNNISSCNLVISLTLPTSNGS